MPDEQADRVIRVNRNELFHPKMLSVVGQRCDWDFERWSVVEEDRNSLGIDTLHIAHIALYNALGDTERFLKGEEFLRRFQMTGGIGLDAKFFKFFAQHPKKIPELWEHKNVLFPGTILRLPNGKQAILCLHSKNTDTHRGIDYRTLDRDFGKNDAFATLLWRH